MEPTSCTSTVRNRTAPSSGRSGRYARPTEQVFILNNEDTNLVIAIRTRIPLAYTIWHLPTFLTADIGTAGAIENKRAAMEADRLYAAIPSIIINIVIVLAGLGAFALFRSQPQFREYMWLGLYLLTLGISNGLLYTSSAGILGLALNNHVADPLIYVYTILQIEFTFSFAAKRVGKLWRSYEGLLLVAVFLSVLVGFGWLSSNVYIVIEAFIILPAALLLPLLLFLWKRQGTAK